MCTLGFVVLLFTLFFSLCQGNDNSKPKLKANIRHDVHPDRLKNLQNLKFENDQADSKHGILGAHALQIEPPKLQANVMGKLYYRRENIDYSKGHPNFTQDYLSLPHSDDSCSSRYCIVAKENLKKRERWRTDNEKVMGTSISGRNLFTVFSIMLKYGQLPEKSQTVTFPQYHTYQTSFWKAVRLGSAFIIENCHKSIVFAETRQSNFVVSVFLDEKSATQCQQVILQKKLTNIVLSIMNVKQILETTSSSRSSSTNVTFDYVIINEKGKLSEGLLPHEFELLLSWMLQISNQTIITLDMESDQNKLKIFMSAWPKPVDLINLACARLSHSKCSIETIEGIRIGWQSATFNVVLTKNVSEENIILHEDLGIPLQFLLSINLTKTSRDALFMLLLESRISIQIYSSVFIRGHQVLKIQSEHQVKTKQEQDTTSSLTDKSDKPLSLKRITSNFKSLEVNEDALKTNKLEHLTKTGHKIVNSDILINLLKDLAKEKQFPERFEAQWNREEKEGLKNVNFDITSRKSIVPESVGNESFDIVDGRPVEEGKSLTEGYTYLNRKTEEDTSLQITSIIHKEKEDAASRIHEAYKGEQLKVPLRSNYLKKPKLRPMEKNIKHKLENKRERIANLSQISNLQHKTVIKLDSLKERGISKMNMKHTAKIKDSNSELKASQNKGNNFDIILKRRRGRNLLSVQPMDILKPSVLAMRRNQLISRRESDNKMMKHLLLKYSKSNGLAQSVITPPPLQSSNAGKSSQNASNSVKIQVSSDPLNEVSYHHMRDIILPHIQTIFKEKQMLSALISGGCPFSMLSAKVAILYPKISLITLNPIRTSTCSDDLRHLLENNFHFHENLDPDIVYLASYTPQLFDFQIISSHIFSWLLQMDDDFHTYLAHILSLSKVSFIEVPDWRHLVSTSRVFGLNAINKWEKFEDFLNEPLNLDSAQIKFSKVKDISTSSWKSLKGSSIYMVEMSSIKRKVHATCASSSQGSSIFNYEKFQSINSGMNEERDQNFPQKGLNLKLLLFLKLAPAQRKTVFSSYLQLNKHTEMCPLKLYWTQGKLWHEDDDNSVYSQYLRAKELISNLNQDIHQNSFSFMDYNSPNRQVGTHLAEMHPNSTFLLAHPSSAEASKKFEEMKVQQLENVIPLDLSLMSEFAKYLLESPDILRYQYFDFVSLLQTFHTDDHNNGKTKLGEILASGLTTFITVPSAEILFLAATTLFPEVFTVTDVASFFENAEQTLLMQMVNRIHFNDTNKQSHEHMQASAGDPFGVLIAINCQLRSVRVEHETAFYVDDKKCKRKCEHPVSYDSASRYFSIWSREGIPVSVEDCNYSYHENEITDGHQRKYMQNVERKESDSQPIVYLLRQEDDYRINYGTVNAISLIALLRMGLLPSMKEEFYSKFLGLPLYEDMAPWNIVFRAGQLEYIDQDTRDKIFEKFAPVAYQVMSALLNYERTISDFGHCKEPAGNQYNIRHISSCVMSEFNGPCPDSRFPVPCGDNSCKSSYIECLRALNKKMTNFKDSDEPLTLKDNSMDQGKDSAVTKTWSFHKKQLL